MKLYAFEKLAAKLDEWGFPTLETTPAFKLIKGVDFKQAYLGGEIDFKPDGIFLTSQGQRYQGYMFLKEAWISDYHDELPKIHLLKCSVIENFIRQGTFESRYEWSNSRTNDVVDKTTSRLYQNVVLETCRICLRVLQEKYVSSAEFFDALDKRLPKEDKQVAVDIFCYPTQWEIISRQFRRQKKFTCEKCGLQPKTRRHHYFWHTHHKDGNKLNNQMTNLQCLCIGCHAQVDSHHQANFNKSFQRQMLQDFLAEYG